MATDYILFVHGVNTRDERETPKFAESLIKGLNQELGQDRTSNIVYIPLYWGDANLNAENRLRKQLQASPLWKDMWFRDFREQQLLQFAGDAALYISRHLGYKVVKRLKEDAIARIQDPQPGDCLHLVTHSWGTVILFDVLFAGRWNNPDAPGHKDVMAIRDAIFGLAGNDKNPLQGMPLASLHTMGSPVAIFSLTNVSSDADDSEELASTVPSTHDITPRLKELLKSLYERRGQKKLPWRNYIHPGDPIAYPLDELMSSLVDQDEQYIDFEDLLSHDRKLLDIISIPLRQTVVALLQGGKAHGSYWESDRVVKEIASFFKPAVAREVVSSK
ncbi:hypothetical protein [Pleurocapsa sp. PCC 7319]|uniref:hypothetical protein n=1 Tax=Pleurocapsa sp. PCC 7319 TaxID=118161 RepID=UPI0003489E4A|nr:hypothetical protein [Pleurocapsa sp. PCC 7319]